MSRLFARLLRQAENDHAFQEWKTNADKVQDGPVAGWLAKLKPESMARRPAIMRTDSGRVVLYPDLSATERTAGRHRVKGKRRMS